VRFSVGGGAGDAQEILRGGGAEHRVDVDAFLEELLAKAAEIDFLLDHDGHDGGLAGEHVKSAGAQLFAKEARDAQQVLAAFGLGPHDLQGRAHRGYRSGRLAGGEDKGTRGVFRPSGTGHIDTFTYL